MQCIEIGRSCNPLIFEIHDDHKLAVIKGESYTVLEEDDAEDLATFLAANYGK